MALVKARVRAEGPQGTLEGVALVDTGASITLLDERAALEIGVRRTGRIVRLVVANGHELEGELVILNRLIVEDEELPGAHALVVEFPARLMERLRSFGLCDWCIIGLATLELLGLSPDTAEGRVRKVGALFLWTERAG